MSTRFALSDLDEVMRHDLMTFIHRCFVELNPQQNLSDAPHLQVIAAKLADCLLGRGPRRLIISLPPRSLKSISVSVAAIAWILGRCPDKQIICASYGQELADKHARDTRTIMTSPFYRRAFPGAMISPKKNSINDFETTKRGFRMATSVGGVLTGRGADIIVIDDPSKPDEVLSETKRDGVNGWFDNSLLSRLNNKEKGIIIIVMQRLHQDDLVGHVLERGENWEVLSFPAIAEQDESYMVQTPFGPFPYARKAGEVLDPTRESLSTLRSIREMIGTYNFSSQYQQNPVPPGGSIVKTDWLQYYDSKALLPRFTTVLQSWDTANKSGELNDYSVCTTWGVFDRKYYLLDVYRARLDYPTLRKKVLEQYGKYGPRTILVEDRASGTQLIQDLKYEANNRVTGYAPPPQSDKVMRLHAQTALFEAGRVLLPNDALWLAEYVREVTSFPGGKFDDQVDSTTQALDFMSQNDGIDVWAKLGRA